MLTHKLDRSEAIDSYLIRRSRTMQPEPRITRTCGNCREYRNGLCQLRARAEWENCYVKPDREACHFAELHPF